MIAAEEALTSQELCTLLFDAELDDEIARAEHALELFRNLGCGPARAAFLDRDVTLDRRVGAGKDPDEPYKELHLFAERMALRVKLSLRPYGEDPKWIPAYGEIRCTALAHNVTGWDFEMRDWSAPPAGEHARVRLHVRLGEGDTMELSGLAADCDALHEILLAFIAPNLVAHASAETI